MASDKGLYRGVTLLLCGLFVVELARQMLEVHSERLSNFRTGPATEAEIRQVLMNARAHGGGQPEIDDGMAVVEVRSLRLQEPQSDSVPQMEAGLVQK